MTGILFPCPGCSTRLLFTRDGRQGLITAMCEQCGVEYAMTPERVSRIDDVTAEGSEEHRPRRRT